MSEPMTADDLAAIRARTRRSSRWLREDVPALLAEVERLRAWKAEALPVMAGLQDLGTALGVGLGQSITGEAAAEKARALVAEVERLRGMLGEVPPPFVRESETLDEARQKIGGLRGALAEAIVERNAACAALDRVRAVDADPLDWAVDEIEHFVYEATATQPAECSDECAACAMQRFAADFRAALADASPPEALTPAETGRDEGRDAAREEAFQAHRHEVLAQEPDDTPPSDDLRAAVKVALVDAAAREDVPALLAEVERLREGMSTLIGDLDTARADGVVWTYGGVQRRLRTLLACPTSADPKEA